MKQIHIEPVTRVEGHGKITLTLDDAGEVSRAQFHVTELRGFERFCEGRTLWEMPGITARICGICPISHILASAKAGDAILAVRVPETAILLRRLMNLGQMIQSHALSFFYLSAPDLLLGWDADPAERNVIGLFQANPDLVRKGVRLRSYGQEIINRLGGKRIHPAWAVPGGVNQALTSEDRQWMRDQLPEAFDTVRETLDALKTTFATSAWRDSLGDFPSLYFGLVSGDHTDQFRDRHLALDQPRRWAGTQPLRRSGHRGLGVVELPEVPVLRQDGLPARHVPGRTFGTRQPL